MKTLSLAVTLLLLGNSNQIRINQLHKDWNTADATVTAADEYKGDGSLDGYQDAVDEVFNENDAGKKQKKIHIDSIKPK